MAQSPAALAADAGGAFVDLDVRGWHWAALVAFIVTLLMVDVLVIHRRPREVSLKEAAIESAVWISIGVAFAGVIWLIGGPADGGAAAGEYLSGFVLEKSLSVDNVFVWAAIFGYFAVPKAYQFRVLFWGVLGALVLRAGFIFAGSALIDRFAVTFVAFGLILLVTAYKVAFPSPTRSAPGQSPILSVTRRLIPTSDRLDGQRLFTRSSGRLVATPLFAILLLVEVSDIVFAVDSVPAIFGVARDPFVVFSSNAFAVLGLRALYFLVGGMQDKLRYLQYGLGAVLVFVGSKMLLTFTTEQFDWPSADFHVPTPISLGVIATIVAVTVLMSLLARDDDSTTDSHVGETDSSARTTSSSPR